MQIQYVVIISALIVIGALVIIIWKLSTDGVEKRVIAKEAIPVKVEESYPEEPDIEYLAFPRLIGMPIVGVFDEVMRMSKDYIIPGHKFAEWLMEHQERLPRPHQEEMVVYYFFGDSTDPDAYYNSGSAQISSSEKSVRTEVSSISITGKEMFTKIFKTPWPVDGEPRLSRESISSGRMGPTSAELIMSDPKIAMMASISPLAVEMDGPGDLTDWCKLCRAVVIKRPG
jgi:hypothetical protein